MVNSIGETEWMIELREFSSSSQLLYLFIVPLLKDSVTLVKSCALHYPPLPFFFFPLFTSED